MKKRPEAGQRWTERLRGSRHCSYKDGIGQPSVFVYVDMCVREWKLKRWVKDDAGILSHLVREDYVPKLE